MAGDHEVMKSLIVSTNYADILGLPFFPFCFNFELPDFGSCKRGKLLLIFN